MTPALTSVWPSTAVAPSSAEQRTSNLAVNVQSIDLFELFDWIFLYSGFVIEFSASTLLILSVVYYSCLSLISMRDSDISFLFLFSPDLHDFPPDSRSPLTAYEGVGTFLACQPPPHYPGMPCMEWDYLRVAVHPRTTGKLFTVLIVTLYTEISALAE